MLFLIVSGIIALAAGIMILTADLLFFEFCSVMDKMVVDVDQVLKPFQAIVGWVLIGVGLILALVAFRYTEYWQMQVVWPLALAFGVLFALLPKLLDLLSNYANLVVFQTKEKLQGFCKFVGSFLVLAGAYILLTAYFIR